MIPDNFKDILSNGENVALLQTIAMFIFLACFIGIVVYVFTRSKKHYNEEANAPLEDDIDENDPFFKKN